jgi:ribonuclease HI
MLKCNVDAACYVEQNFYCIAACLRDDKGQFVATFAKRFEGQRAIDEAEAIGVMEALKCLHSTHNEASIIETDSLHVVQSIGSSTKNISGNVIEACRRLLNLNRNCKVTYIRSQANRVAHDSVQATRFTTSSHIYNYCPPGIETTIMNEMH